MSKGVVLRVSRVSAAARSFAVMLLVSSVIAPEAAHAIGGTGGSSNGGAGAGGVGGAGFGGTAGGDGTTSGTGASGGGGGSAGGGTGGTGGGHTGGKGGTGGTQGTPNGQAGNAGTGSGAGGGGGGGFNGNGSGAATVANAGSIIGGTGGAGGAGVNGGAAAGGGGGEGGYGAIVTGSAGVNTNTGTISGGTGGAGGTGNGANITGGLGGGGGVALLLNGAGQTFTNSGFVTGGTGGVGGNGTGGASNGAAGLGGIAIEGGSLTIVNSGTIAGGLSGDGGPRAEAILFLSGTNTLTLEAGSSITGIVGALGTSNTLALGGTVNPAAAFDVSAIGTATTSQYQGFTIFQKTGTSTWALTGTTSVVTSWDVVQGTLSISSDGNLGGTSGTLTFDGGTLQFAANNIASARNITLNASGGTIDNAGNTVTLSGVISGTGGLTSVGNGTLILTGNNTFSGTTTISAGTLQVGNGGATGALVGPITDGTVLVFNVNGATGVTSVISGAGSVTQEGTGVLTLSATNTYAGGTLVTNGLINFNSAANFSTGIISLNGGGLQWATGTSTDISQHLNTIFANGATFDTNGNNVTFGTALSGPGGVTKAGAGVLTFAVDNTYQGGTTVTGGLINFAAASNFGAGKITLNGGGLQWKLGNTADISADLNPIGTGGGTFDTNGNDVSLATPITGVVDGKGNKIDGGITKAGNGTLTLTAAETYGGGTTISGGTLVVGAGGSITGTGSVVDNGTLSFNQPGDTTFDGAISGNGQLIWSGPGKLTLSGDNSAFTGTTTINGPLLIDATGNTALTGVIQGSGSLAQNGGGILTLGGANTYTGGTLVSKGLINFNSAANFSTGLITLDGGGLQWAKGNAFDITTANLNKIGAGGATFDTNGNNVSFANALDGTGSVTKTGAGVLTFKVANTYQGTTTVTGGLIDFSSLSDFGSLSSITLNGGGLQWAPNTTIDVSTNLNALGASGGIFDTNGNNVTLAAALSGAGGIAKAGLGTLTLAPTETYTGPTVVTGGILLVTGSIASSSIAIVASGGTLAGNGTIPSLVVLSGGTVQPSPVGGTRSLTVAGTATFENGATYVADVTAAGSDRLVVSGSASLAGTLTLAPTGGFGLGQQFTILSAQSSSGTFSTITTTGTFGAIANGAALVPVVSYGAGDVVITLDAGTISPFLPLRPSANAKSIAAAIDTAMTNDGAVVTFAPLSFVSSANLPASLASFTGEVAVTAQNTAISSTDGFVDTLADAASVGDVAGRRVGGRAMRPAPAQMGGNNGGQGLDIWIAGGGARDNSDAVAKLGSHASSANDVGGVLGIGYRAPSGRAAIGLALGYDTSDFKMQSLASKGRANGYQGGLYGALMLGRGYVSGIASFESYDLKTNRLLAFNGANAYQGKVTANGESFRLEVGRHLVFGEGWLSPYINGQVQELDTPAYAETTLAGSSNFALSYAKQNHTDLTSELGAEYDSGFPSRADGLLTTHLRLGWLHDYAGGLNDLATFEGFAGAIFTVRGTSPSKDAAHAVFGFEEDLGGLALTVDADALYGKSSHSYGGRAGLAYRL